MFTTWEKINYLAGSDDVVVTINLGYDNVLVIVRYGEHFKCTNLRQEDHQYDIEEAIMDTIIQHKKELMEEH